MPYRSWPLSSLFLSLLTFKSRVPLKTAFLIGIKSVLIGMTGDIRGRINEQIR
ncbi:hypothetical protein SAMN05878482_1011120 [Peribacillus simplex]|uniref:Uncharacterized protein n=1 Tax=Peribacillus simplex TaxID=1478 RepID=A0A9X8R4X0_9BACI|nr:hypothetical protein SAMN05878482_1011120 [Peribacillus simplex]